MKPIHHPWDIRRLRRLCFTAICIALLCGVGTSRARERGESPDPGPVEAWELAPGLIVESVRAALEPPVDAGDRIITLVRIDPQRYRFRLLTAAEHGSRAAQDWLREFGLTGVINASMFRGDGRSTGLMVDGKKSNNERVHPGFGAFFAFDPVKPGIPPIAIEGKDCPGFDLGRLRADYRVVIQNYRMLDCQGRPIPWVDPKIYSVAAIAVDKEGRAVFIHSRTPYRMREFNEMIGAEQLGLVAAMFVEGGPEASLLVETEGGRIERTGSWETGFFDDSNTRLWKVPNVIGFQPRTSPPGPRPEDCDSIGSRP